MTRKCAFAAWRNASRNNPTIPAAGLRVAHLGLCGRSRKHDSARRPGHGSRLRRVSQRGSGSVSLEDTR